MKRPLVWLVALLALGLGGWRLAWGWAAGKVETEMDRMIALEASKGRDWRCANRRVEGFPKSLEVTCEQPSVTIRRPNGADEVWRLERAVAIAQVTRPTSPRIAFTGPALLERGGAGQARLSWKFLEIGLQGLPRPDRISLLGDEVKLEAQGLPPVEVKALKAGLDMASTPTQPLASGAARLGLTLGELRFAPLAAALKTPVIDLEANGDLAQARAFLAPGPLPVRLEAWRLAGGDFALGRLHVWTPVEGGPRLQGEGRLMLDEARRPAGEVSLSASGVGELAQAWGLDSRAVALGGALGGLFGGKPATQPAGPRSLNLRLRLDQGAVWIGPLRTPLRLPPLY